MKIKLFHKNKRCIYFIATPIHGNLGDHAIVYAQYVMMDSLGYMNNVIEITRPEYEMGRKWLKKIISPKDIIIIDGGGNIGTLWIEEEYKMRDIIQIFPRNHIFIFPQTAYFSDDEQGKYELSHSVEIYSAHEKLVVYCRDQVTYELFKEKFCDVKSYFVPDIVLSLSADQQVERKQEVLMCFRDDLEKICSQETKEKIKKYLELNNRKIRYTSTLVSQNVRKSIRSEKLVEKWKEFSQAELVITDRLHGMIFSAITGTPCIALDNVSHKVRYGYQWIKELPYIKFCEDNDEEIIEVIHNMLSQYTSGQYDTQYLIPYYDKIKEEIRNAMDE